MALWGGIGVFRMLLSYLLENLPFIKKRSPSKLLTKLYTAGYHWLDSGFWEIFLISALSLFIPDLALMDYFFISSSLSPEVIGLIPEILAGLFLFLIFLIINPSYFLVLVKAHRVSKDFDNAREIDDDES